MRIDILIGLLASEQITLSRNGEKLRWEGPSGAMTSMLKAAVEAHREELLAQLDRDGVLKANTPSVSGSSRRWRDRHPGLVGVMTEACYVKMREKRSASPNQGVRNSSDTGDNSEIQRNPAIQVSPSHEATPGDTCGKSAESRALGVASSPYDSAVDAAEAWAPSRYLQSAHQEAPQTAALANLRAPTNAIPETGGTRSAATNPTLIGPLGPSADPWSPEDWQALFDETAACLEYSQGLDRREAESRALEIVLSEWMTSQPASSDAARPLRALWRRKRGGGRPGLLRP